MISDCKRLPIEGLLLTLSLAIAGSTTSAQQIDAPHIRVTGSAEVLVVPDSVVLEFSVDSRGKQVGEASKDNSKKTAEIIAFAKEAGIDARQIRTENLRIRPLFDSRNNQSKYHNQKADPFGGSDPQSPPANALPVPIGYTVQHSLSIRMKHPGPFEKIYPGLIERGVNEVDSIKFESSKRETLKAQARVTAINNARQKAHTLVETLDATLAGVHSIEETRYEHDDDGDPFGPFGSAPETIAMGQISVTAAVTVVFTIANTEFEK